MQPGFGDSVRVVDTPETREHEIAGLVGQVYGETTPSVTGVDVIGRSEVDFALSVSFEGRAETVWLAPHLVEFVDHAPGTTISIGLLG